MSFYWFAVYTTDNYFACRDVQFNFDYCVKQRTQFWPSFSVSKPCRFQFLPLQFRIIFSFFCFHEIWRCCCRVVGSYERIDENMAKKKELYIAASVGIFIDLRNDVKLPHCWCSTPQITSFYIYIYINVCVRCAVETSRTNKIHVKHPRA